MLMAPENVSPVCAVVGGDRFLRNEALVRFLGPPSADCDALGPSRVDGSKAELAEVLDEVRTPSLLGGRRVVIVEEADAFISAHRTALEKYCSSPSQTGVLVFLSNTLPRNTRLCRIIEASGTVCRLVAPKGPAIVNWIIKRARAPYDKQLTHDGAATLRRHVGDSLGSLDSELSKLAAFVGERDQITVADIETLTGQQREERVFAVMDAIGSKDTESALRHWEQVLATDRAAPSRAIGGLAWSVRQLLGARREWENGTSIRELAGKMHTDPDLLRLRLERTTVEQLEAQQRDLLAADLAAKTGASTVEVAIEKFIVKHCATSASASQAASGIST